MRTVEVTNDTYKYHQEDDLAVITILEGGNILSTVRGKENLADTVNTIKEDQQIKGLAILYSDKYLGDVEYRKLLQENLENKNYDGKRYYETTYKFAITQFLKIINTFPKPIVGGMDGDIGPTSFAINLALDLRIASENARFFHPNLKFGFPPSPPLSYYLVQNLGPQKATELILTKPEFTAQDALDLGLITQIVTVENLQKTCLDKLRQLSAISGNALVESRRMLQPDIDKMREYIDAGFDGAVRCLNKMKR